MDTNRGRYKRGIDVRQLQRLPILPAAIRDGVINSLDVSTAIRNHLRDLLALDTIDRNKSALIQTIEKEVEYIKSVKHIRATEWKLMENHAKILLSKDRLFNLPLQKALQNLDVPQSLAEEYNLLNFSSFINYLRNEREGGPFEICSTRPCEHLYGIRERIHKKNKHYEKPTPLPKKVESNTNYESREATKPIAMQVFPEEVVFVNYEIGYTYVKRVILQNSGANSALLRFVRPQDSSFEVSLAKKYNTLAPGLSVLVTVSFHCSDKDDRFDKFVVQPGGGSCVTVPIRATQAPPLLQSISQYGTLKLHESNLKTINCGRCHVGTVNIIRPRIFNSGSDGRFFIMSEMSWYFNTIKDTTLENVLVLKPFYIQPMHFSLGYNRKRKLKIIFAPKWEGSHLIQLFILCDNITMNNIDVLGEAVMFDPELLVIEGLQKNYNVLFDADNSAEYYLHLGRVLSNSSRQKTFDIANNSVVETKFSWEISKADIPGVADMAPELCSIMPSEGSLCPEVKMMFTVTFNSYDLPVGKYAAIFSLYLESIPKAALLKKHSYYEQTEISEMMVKLCLGKIEVWVEIETPNVCIWPNFLYFRNAPNVWNYKKVYVTNYEDICISITWQTTYKDHLMVTPSLIDLAPYSSTYVYVMVLTDMVGRIIGTTQAFFLQSLCKYEVGVECDTVFDLTTGMSEIKDFGTLRKGELKTGIIHATFQTTHEVKLDLKHISMRYHKKTGLPYFYYFRPTTWVVKCPSYLIPDQPAEVVIRARTKEEQICIDLFEWRFYGIEAYTTILTDVQEQDITLSPVIVDIQQPIFVGEIVTCPMKIVNHRQLLTSFKWECFFGHDMDLFKLTSQPKQATLYPASETEILLTLIASKQGVFQDLYFSFSITYMEKPLIGMIRGVVRESLVAISWLNAGKDFTFTWPQEEYEIDRQCPSEETSITESSSDKNCEICFTDELTSCSSFKSISTGEKNELDIMDYIDSSYMEGEIVPYDNWPYIGGKYYGAVLNDPHLRKDFEMPWTEETLAEELRRLKPEEVDWFLAQHSDHTLNFNVETYKVYTQNIFITNLSPISVNYKIKTRRFRGANKLPPVDPFLVAEMVFHDQGLGNHSFPTLEKFKWTHRVQNNLGLVIRVKEKSGTLERDKIQTVAVSVFAVAWGTYFDDICIFVDNHPPFHVPVMVNCDYPPAFFTFAPDVISPLLRFPSVRHNKVRSKHVYLENTSPFFLKIVWTCYLDLKPELNKDYCLPLEKEPDFSLGLELHPKEETDFCKLKLIPYTGLQENVTYTVEPTVLYIPPKSKAPLCITINSQKTSHEEAQNNVTLSGTALGVVYVEDDDWKKEDHIGCYRPDGYSGKPISLKMSTVIEELNVRVINNSKRDRIFKVNTSEIFNTDAEHVSTRTFHIKNFCSSPSLISVRVQEPFHITSIETSHGPLEDITQEFLVDSFKTVEVNILLLLNKAILTKATALKPSYLSYTGPIISELNFGEKGAVENIIKLELHLLKPIFKFPTEKINFGLTCLMENGAKHIDVHVQNGDQPFKVVIAKNDEDAFTVKPLLGLIREGKPTRIHIDFAPRECRRYVNVIEFISSTPGSIYPLIVEGYGSLDHKFYT